MAEPRDLLVADGLYVSRDGLPILRDVSLRVSAGEAVAVLGGNGSGKSTLIRTVVGLIPHQKGTVSLLGTPLEQFRDWARVGYVPQHSALNVTNATVKEIVTSGRLSHRRPFQWFSGADKAAVASALELVELSDRARWPFTKLSGGQKQRTLIARALAAEPDLLIMDEPFAGVDLHSQAELAALLGRLRANGLGLAVVLHEIGPMADVVDRFVTLCDGRVVDDHLHTAHDCDPTVDDASTVGLNDPLSSGRS